MQTVLSIIGVVALIIVGLLLLITIYDRFFQRKNLVMANFPLAGRMRYVFHELRPFFRQYFGDDNSWAPRIIIDWVLSVSEGRTGYFSFDKFDTTGHLHDGHHQMIHAPNPLNPWLAVSAGRPGAWTAGVACRYLVTGTQGEAMFAIIAV